jgi:hypothetical protein
MLFQTIGCVKLDKKTYYTNLICLIITIILKTTDCKKIHKKQVFLTSKIIFLFLLIPEHYYMLF